MLHSSQTSGTTSSAGVFALLLGLGLGAAIGFLLRRPVMSALPARSGRSSVVDSPDIVDIASEESFPASDAPAY